MNVDEGGAPEWVGGLKLLTVADARRQAHARARRARGSCASATSTRSSRRSSRSRSRPSSARSTRADELRALADAGARQRAAPARRRRAADQRRRRARLLAAPRPASRRRRDLVRRHEGRAALRRGGRVRCAPSSPRARCTCASSRCSSRRRCASSPRSSRRCSSGERWRASAGHANAMAQRLAERVARDRRRARSPSRSRPTSSSRSCPPGAAERLQRDWLFYTWDEAHRRGALDVLVGHDRGGRRRVRRRGRGGGRIARFRSPACRRYVPDEFEVYVNGVHQQRGRRLPACAGADSSSSASCARRAGSACGAGSSARGASARTGRTTRSTCGTRSTGARRSPRAWTSNTRRATFERSVVWGSTTRT